VNVCRPGCTGLVLLAFVALAACSGGAGNPAPSGLATAKPQQGPSAPASTPTPTPSPRRSSTPGPTPTATATPRPTSVPSATPSPSPTPSPTPAPTQTPPPTPTPSRSARPTPAPTASAAPAAPLYTPLPADVAIAPAALPTPFDPSLPLGSLGTTRLPNAYATLSRLVRRDASLRRPASGPIVGANDHEAAGIFTSPGDGAPYNALFATQTAYEATQLPFPYPSRANGEEHIFSPTTFMGWGSCLEASTYYNSTPAAQTAHFTIYNFCLPAPAFIFDTPIDAQFLTDYVRIGADGLPSYAMETFTPDFTPAATSVWYTVLYNYTAARYDLIASAPAASAAFTPNSAGWSIVELYAAQGPCPHIAPSSAAHVSFHNTLLRAWLLEQPMLTDYLISYVGYEGGSANACFTPSGSLSAAFQFSVTSPNWSWNVTSP
jgi:hypothetical protein